MHFHLSGSGRTALFRAGRDPAFDDLGDSFWLGGEAQVAPSVLAQERPPVQDDDLDDPEWLVI